MGFEGTIKRSHIRITGELNTLKDKIHKLILLYSTKQPVTIEDLKNIHSIINRN